MPRLFTVGVATAAAVIVKLRQNKNELERPRHNYAGPNLFIEGIKTINTAPEKTTAEVSKDSQGPGQHQG